MQTINELCLAWYLFVNSNYDVLIMSITLLVVSGLVLEVIRLNKLISQANSLIDYDFQFLSKQILTKDKDQVNVNTHFAEDIDRIDKKVNQLKMVCDAWGIKAKKNK